MLEVSDDYCHLWCNGRFLNIASQSAWHVRVDQDGKRLRGIGIMPLMMAAGNRYVEG